MKSRIARLSTSCAAMEVMMKKWKMITVALAMALLTGTGVFAQNVTTDVHAEKGNLMALGGVGYGWRGFGVSGGVEYMLQKFNIPGFPLSMGVMALANADFGSGFGLSAAGMATLHWGMKAYKDFPEFLQKFDWYIGLGLGVGVIPFGIGISSGGGISYYMNDKLAIDAHSFYLYDFGGGSSGAGATLGIRYKLK